MTEDAEYPGMGGLVAIDVGNSRAKLGWFRRVPEADEFLTPDLSEVWSHAVVARFPDVRPDGVVVGSVVPDATDRLREAIPPDWPAPRVLGPSDFGLTLDLTNPEAVGVDRVADAAAGWALFGAATIVVDSGTATTADLVLPDGRGGAIFAGGAILPGVQVMADSLTTRAAKLPALVMHELCDVPLPGQNTMSAIAAGVVYGHSGAVREVVGRLKVTAADRGFPDVRTVLCGGATSLLSDTLTWDVADRPHLTLSGLVIAAGCRGGGKADRAEGWTPAGTG